MWSHEIVTMDADLARAPAEYVGGLLWLRGRDGGYTAVDPVTGTTTVRADRWRHCVGRVQAVAQGFVLANAGGKLIRLSSDGHLAEQMSIAARITSLHDAGPWRILVLTKGALVAVDVDAQNGHTSQEADAAARQADM